MINLDSQVRHAATRFPIGDPVDASPLGHGHVHETWLIRTGDGSQYVLQALNPGIGTRETANMVLVTTHLEHAGMLTPALIASRAGEVTIQEGARMWRMLTFIPGTTIEHEPSPIQAESAAHLLGRFHSMLADIPAPLLCHVPHFHDTAYLHARMHDIHDHAAPSKKGVCEPLVSRIDELLLPRLSLLATQPQRIVHGDPKINNFRFDSTATRAVCLLDLDTVGAYPLIIEIGDMLRSTTTRGPIVDPVLWEHAVQGYLSSPADITEQERAAIPDGFVLCALELAVRSITDAYEESFFRHDRARFASLFEQNLARARLQIARVESFLGQEETLRIAAS